MTTFSDYIKRIKIKFKYIYLSIFDIKYLIFLKKKLYYKYLFTVFSYNKHEIIK